MCQLQYKQSVLSNIKRVDTGSSSFSPPSVNGDTSKKLTWPSYWQYNNVSNKTEWGHQREDDLALLLAIQNVSNKTQMVRHNPPLTTDIWSPLYYPLMWLTILWTTPRRLQKYVQQSWFCPNEVRQSWMVCEYINRQVRNGKDERKCITSNIGLYHKFIYLHIENSSARTWILLPWWLAKPVCTIWCSLTERSSPYWYFATKIVTRLVNWIVVIMQAFTTVESDAFTGPLSFYYPGLAISNSH